MSEIILKRQFNAVELFNGKTVDPLLSEIRKEVESHVVDVTTKKGQKEGRSLAAKVAKTKTYLDSLGKELVAEQKESIKAVDSERKKLRDELDGLKADVLAPIIDAENKEKYRLDAIKAKTEEIRLLSVEIAALSVADIESRISSAESLFSGFDWEEYEKPSRMNLDETLGKLNSALTARKQYEADQAELKRLKLAEEKRKQEEERKANELKAAKEAEEKAKREAEEAEKRKAEEEARRKREAEEQAKRIKDAEEAAAKRERERIAEEAAKQKAEQERLESEAKEAEEKRLSDEKHKSKIRKEIVEAMIESGAILRHSDGLKLCLTIENRQIPHVSIKF